jgi:hypothetical protein
MWGYIYKQGIAPVYVGEFGTGLSDPKDAPWLEAITSYMSGDFNNDGTSDIPAGKQGISWTFWSWNPNSGDTGGILGNDWNSVNQAKLAYLTPIQFDFDSDVPGGGMGPGTGPEASFVLTLSKPATEAVTVDFHTVAGTASSADFTGRSGSVTFAPGEQSKTISIAITPDQASEANEHFTVVLTNAAGATLTRAIGTATIVDDDAPVTPPPVTPPATPPAGSGDLHAQFSVVDSWIGGFNGDIAVHNDGAGATRLEDRDRHAVPDHRHLNAKILSHDANGYVIGNATWNGNIAHDGEVSFGFVASGQLNPSSVHVHGLDQTPDPAAPPPAPPVDEIDFSTMFSPYIDMAMPVDADLVAISHASGIQNFTLAFMLSSDHGIGWQGVGSIADDTLANGTTILSQVQATQAAGGHITISPGGAAGQEAALTAPSAAVPQAEYQSVIDRHHITSIDFDIEGAAELNRIRSRCAIRPRRLQAANRTGVVTASPRPVPPTGPMPAGSPSCRAPSMTACGSTVNIAPWITVSRSITTARWA